MYLHKEYELQYKPPCIYHAVAGLILDLGFYTEEPDGVRDMVKIFLLPGISISTGSEASLVARWWDMALDRSTLITYTNTDSLP